MKDYFRRCLHKTEDGETCQKVFTRCENYGDHVRSVHEIEDANDFEYELLLRSDHPEIFNPDGTIIKIKGNCIPKKTKK